MTRLLNDARADAAGGNAANALFPLVYQQLREIAGRRMAGERAEHTLQATALVHEAYVRLVGVGTGGGSRAVPWSGRQHFFFAAAEAMRRILIDHARARSGPTRGGGRRKVPISNVLDLAAAVTADDDGHDLQHILALDDAISRLEQLSPAGAAIVRLRFFAGLTVEEVAQTVGCSARTVKREWTYARAWLARELAENDQD